ncbi:PREDICTED: FH [Prunus dulcis]|uniref:PREDICTED: FH n=1 Tax=Prunus dulcis TaxID=3755 RepID=A0A5E4G7Q0_PRUDU|nr:hypothetical protein L3X38_030524 [Prunus dulcis]VVA35807.1 PREDICTED: FH [Prunus dulcis]
MAMELKKSSVIRLNVGGNKFCTSVDTLTQREPNSMLAAIFSGRHNIACEEDCEKGDIINFILSNATMKFRGFNLSGLDLSKLDLTKIDFSYACLRNVCFSGANLRDASFVDAKLRFTKIKSACLVNCSFLRAILYNAHLYDADLTNANFEAASLECAALKNLKATNTANFTDAYLISSGVQDVNLQHLVGAKLGVVTACGNGFICKKPDEIR